MLTGIKRVSKPGLRVYVQKREIPRVFGGLGVAILSTPEGVMTGQHARQKSVGGEVFATCGRAMSRIGKMPIPVPSSVKIEIDGRNVSVTGPKGHPEARGASRRCVCTWRRAS